MNCKKRIIVFAFFSVFFVLFSCISLWRFNTAQIFYYDFGIFARALWQIANGLNPLIIHKTLGEIHFLGDHFSPSLYLLTPLFWITNRLEILLIEQALAITLSGLLIYLITRAEKHTYFVSLSISFVFFIFAGITNPLVTDWHTEPSAGVFILLFIYLFFYRKKYVFGSIAALIFLGWKESNAISLLLSLIPYFILKKGERYKILLLGCFALFWFFLTTKILIPFLIGQPYFYIPLMPHSLLEYGTQFFNLPQKRQFFFQTFISFGFLPLISVPFLIPVLGELGIRLIPIESHFQSYSLGMHYNVFLGIFLALGTINALSIFTKKYIQIFFVTCLLVVSLIVAKKVTLSPILLVSNTTFWKEWNMRAPLLGELSCIPTRGSIMSQNNILPHLIQRKERVFLLSFKYKKMNPDYIAVDLSSGQNPNNFYSGEINDYSQVLTLIKTIESDTSYVKMTSSCKYLLLFKRK